MGEMRDRMEKELKLRGYSPRTITAYVRVVHSFVRHHRRPAETMGSTEARAYLLHLIEERKLAWPTVNQAVCALRFYYGQVLRRPFEVEMIPYQKRKKRLPFALSEREVAALLAVERNLKHRAILMTMYSGGLRLCETIQLRPADIESTAMRIRIRAGKGGKETTMIYTHVSRQALTKVASPLDWLAAGATELFE